MLSKKENLDPTCPASVIQHLLFKEHNKKHEINVQAESVSNKTHFRVLKQVHSGANHYQQQSAL